MFVSVLVCVCECVCIYTYLGHQLDVKGACDVECLGNGRGDLLHLANGLYEELLRR